MSRRVAISLKSVLFKDDWPRKAEKRSLCDGRKNEFMKTP